MGLCLGDRLRLELGPPAWVPRITRTGGRRVPVSGVLTGTSAECLSKYFASRCSGLRWACWNPIPNLCALTHLPSNLSNLRHNAAAPADTWMTSLTNTAAVHLKPQFIQL
jgi:hypothetical protein